MTEFENINTTHSCEGLDIGYSSFNHI